MSINLICSKCYRTRKLRVKKCSCGSTLSKFKVRVKTPTGWLSKQVPTLDLAKKTQLKFQSQTILEGIGVHKVPALSEVWKRYLAWAELHKPGSWKDDDSRYRLHWETFSNLKLDKIEPPMIQRVLDSMVVQEGRPNAGQPQAPATKRQVLQLLSRLYNWSIQQRLYYGMNPCKAIKLQKFDNKKTENLTPEEINRLLSVLESDQNERASLVIAFALYTGKRKSEILNLTWQDVDFENNMVTFRDTKNTETHTVPVNQQAIKVLRKAEGLRISELVFPCSSGQYFHSFSRTWYRIRKKAGIDIRLHGLRHVFSSHLASSGKVDLFVLKELLGHKDVKMTMRYSHIMNAALRKGAETLPF